jgi:hypothetical protein
VGPGRRVLWPNPLYLSPRARTLATLAVTALTERLTPPPGAPETRGQRTLIFEEGPPLLTAIALTLGSGPLTLVTIEEETAEAAKAIAASYGLYERLEVIHSPLGVLTKERPDFNEAFSLIVVSLSPYALSRRLGGLFNWLAPLRGRLIVTGMTAGAQGALILRNAFKAGFFLHSSATLDDYCVINLAKRPPRPEPVWEWTPGAWLSELTQDELSILEEAEAQERKSPPPAAISPLEEV